MVLGGRSLFDPGTIILLVEPEVVQKLEDRWVASYVSLKGVLGRVKMVSVVVQVLLDVS